MKGSEPTLNTNGYINIKKGRHPLIPKDTVVPIDVWLGDTFDLLIVTGPNTGGKTVSLKTVGLFTLMGQAGLHIPADEGSSLSIFEEVYADIGDEQSIEQSLSTFSSHMTKIVTILDKADQNSLVLFDELGAGTDPVEGAALATSILSFLHNMKVPTIATTHYSELKVFALTTEGVENASCEFNVETLRPTYRLLIGIPGKSNAFAISSKLGLPAFIIEDAKKRVTDDNIAFEDVLSDLEQSKSVIQQEKLEIEAYKAEIKTLKQQLEKKQERLDDRRESILRNANEEAARILKDAKEFADQTVKEINKFAKSGDTKSLEASRRNAKEQLSKTREKLSIGANLKAKNESHKIHKPSEFKVGYKVKVLSMNVEGIVRSLPNAKNEVSVQMGILQSNINIRDLVIVQEDAPTTQKMSKGHASGIKVAKSMTTSTEIKLIGMNSDDALATLDKYLDDAYLSHMPSVRIVHGKGSGILRTAVHKYLKKCNYVKEFHLAEFGEGDAGVTIAVFK
jgi:DNA mismatch repair protein MutS2